MSVSPALELTLLGSPSVKMAGQVVKLRPPVLALLAYLVLEGPCAREALITTFYTCEVPGCSDQNERDHEQESAKAHRQADGRLRTALFRLRKSALGSALRSEGDRVSLEAHCDALELQRALEAGDLERARSLFGPLLLEHLPLESGSRALDWLRVKRQTWSTRYSELLGLHLADLVSSGQLEAALSVARTRLACDPDSVGCCNALVERLLALGRRGEAEGVQSQFRARLENDLGVTPQLVALPPLHPASSSSSVRLECPPLVGRESLWRRVEAWFAESEGVLVLRGAAGVGKSRLAQEALQARGGGSFILQGSESGQDLAYGSLEPLLHRERARWQGVKARWARELEALLPELGGTPTESPSSPQAFHAVRQRTVLALGLYHLLAQGEVLRLEDLHWIDPASLEVVRQMLLEHPGAGLKVLATTRPGEALARPERAAWWRDLERAGQLSVLDLEALGEGEVGRLLRQLAGGPLPAKLVRSLFGRCGGNPYALLSLLRGLFEDTSLHLDPAGRWVLPAGSTLQTALPAPVGETLLRQLGDLPQAVWRLLEAAALLGTSFDFSAALAGSALKEDEAITALERVLGQRGVQLLDQNTETYRFGHDLLRQAVAGRLNPARARRVHLRLADHLERHAGRPAQVAQHWFAAGELERALPMWQGAADEAARVYAHREALGALEHALQCRPRLSVRLQLHFQQVKHLKALNDLEGWDAVLVRMEQVLSTPEGGQLEGGALEEAQLRLALERTHHLWNSQRLEEALEVSAPFAEGARNSLRGTLLHDRGCILNDLGRGDEARRVLKLAFTHLDDEDALLKANLHNALAQCVQMPSGYREALEHGQAAVELFKALDNWAGQANAWASCSMLYHEVGDRILARATLEQALEAATTARHLNLRVWCLDFLCELLVTEAAWESGLERATQGLELCEEENHPEGRGVFEGWLEQLRDLRAERDALQIWSLTGPEAALQMQHQEVL